MSYLHVCVTRGVVVTAYVDHATGSMTSLPDGSGRFTEACFIANSVGFPVHHEPVVLTG